MEPFAISETISEGTITFDISGYIGETAKFPPITFVPTVRLRLALVKGMNSVGTRAWCSWMKQMKSPTLVRIESCPVIVVKCLNQVFGALPENSQILSFFVPYIAPDGSRINVLYRRDHEFSSAGVVNHPSIKDSQGRDCELDVLPDYFKFLVNNV